MVVSPSRNQGIDALRGASIVLVVMLHLAIRLPLSRTDLAMIAPRWVLNALCYNGAESVLVFFVISGFLIAGNAIDRWGSLGTPRMRAFYVRRAARILPCLLALVAVISALDLLRVPDYTITRADQSLPGAIFAALSFHLNWYESYSNYLPASWDVLWSLSVEEVFYIVFPLACLFAARGSAPLVALLILLAASLPVTRGAIHGNELLREKAYLPGMAAIATGVLAAMAVRRWRPGRQWQLVLKTSGVLCWLCVMLAEDFIWPHLGESTMLVLTVGSASLLVGLYGSPRLRLPGFGWLRAFGRLSYEVYLTHMFVVFTALDLFHAAGLPDRVGYLLYPAVLAGSLGVGVVVARALSQPAEAWVRLRWQPRQAVLF